MAMDFRAINILAIDIPASKVKVPCSMHGYNLKFKSNCKLKVVCHGMLAPRKFMQRRRKEEVFKDAADENEQKTWRRMMKEIEESGSAVPVLRTQRSKKVLLPRDVVLGTILRFKQLKKWNLVSEILEWLRTQHWWNFSEMDFLMLITAYGKLGDYNKAERVLKYMSKKGFAPSVISQTALMEAYGRSKKYSQAEAVFRRMQTLGPEPSPITYQIILRTFVEADKYSEAEAVFQELLKEERATFKPDQKMFHMMIYMYKKSGDYQQARKLFSEMSERGLPQTTVTYNSLMSFETSYKEVSNIYGQMQKAGQKPDVISYSLLISAYGKARRDEEAFAVFEEMLDAGVRPTRKAYNILLDAFAISGMVEQARTVFKSMKRNRCEPDLCSYATVLSAYVNASDMDGAEKFFRRIKEDGLKPNAVIYGTLMKGYAKLDKLERVMRVYERMRVQGVEPNQTIFTTIMDAHGKNSDFISAVKWFKEMAAFGCPPDQKAKNVLLSLAKTADEQAEANALVEMPADQLKLEPNTSIGSDVSESGGSIEATDLYNFDDHDGDDDGSEESNEEQSDDEEDSEELDQFSCLSFKGEART